MPKFLNPITITTPGASAPLIVNSSTLVSNLNADLLDGQHGSFYQNAGNLNAGTVPLARLSGSYNIDITGSSAFVFVNDTRNNVTGPQTGYRQVRADFLNNATDGLNDGGSWHGVLTFQQWADASGGGTRQLGFTDNDNLWIRGSGTGLTAYNAWKLMLNSVNFSSYALPLSGGTLTGNLALNTGVIFNRGSAPSITNIQCSIFNELNGIGSAESLNFRAYAGFKWQYWDGSATWMQLTSAGLTINGNLTSGSGYQLRWSDGSAASPGYSFFADTDTGIHRSADNTLALVTGGTIRATVNSSGNLGVNVASALYRLQTDTAALFNRTAFGVLDINSNGSPNFIKIQTAIPFSYGSQAYTVNIRGFTYDGSQTVDITVCWHQYLDTFYNPTVSSSGSFAPTVRLARENSNVVICLTWGAKYWPKLYVESVHNFDLQSYSTGWSWSDADITGDKIVTLSYKNDWGGGMSKDSSGNLTVTGNITANGIILNRERNQNARLYSATTGAMGLLGVDSAAAFRWQIYGESGNYGFLDSTWGNWDIKKGVNDQLDIRVSGSLVRVLNAGNYQNYALPLTGGTLTGKLSINSTGAWNDAQALLTVGSGGDGRIQVRHIWGKSAANNNADHLWLNYQNANGHVQIGDSGGGNNLYVSGQLYAGGYFGGSLVLHAGNYTSYAAGLGTYNTLTNVNQFRSNVGNGIYLGASNNPPLQAFSNDGGAAFMSFHRSGSYAVNMGLDPDNVLRIGGWSASANRWQLDMSGNQTLAGSLTAVGGIFSGTISQGIYSRRQIEFTSPAANFGNFKQFLRLWSASGGGSNLFTLRVSVRSTWNWAAAYGGIEAFYSLYLPGDGTISSLRDFRITHVSGPAIDNIRLGDAVIENGFVSIPVWCANTNPIYATVEQWNGSAILGTTTTAVSEALPAFIAPSFRGGLTSDGPLTVTDSNSGVLLASTNDARFYIRSNTAGAWLDIRSETNGYAAVNLYGGTATTGRWSAGMTGGNSNYRITSGAQGAGTVFLEINSSTNVTNFPNALQQGGNAVLTSATTSAPNLSIGGNAATATNASQLGGNAAANFVQGQGSRGRSTSRHNGTANSLTDPSGFYYGANATGMPTTDWWHWIQSIGNDWSAPDGYGYQLACSYWGDDLRLRRLESGTWKSWVQLLHSGNYNSYALPLTGGTLTGGLSGTSGSFSGDVTWSGYNSGNARAVRIGYSGGNYGSIGYGINYTSTTGSHTYAFNDAVTRIDLADGIQVYSAAGAAAGTTVGWTTLLNASRGNASMQWKGNNVLDASNYNSYALPLSGGTLTGAVTFGAPVVFGSSGRGRIYADWTADTSTRSFFAGRNSTDTDWNWGAEFGWDGANQRWYFDTVPFIGGNAALHAGNYSGYALPIGGGTLTGLLTASYTTGGSGWTNIQIDAAPASGAAYIRANRATAATGEVGFVWATGGANKWINYLNVNADTLSWYQGSAVVMTLTTGGALSINGAFTAASASFSGALTSGGNSVLTVGNYSSYAVDNTKRVKQFFWDTISASTTQARRFEIARIAIDIVNWNQVGTFEIELSEQYWSNGLKKKYIVSYGYNSPRAVLKLVEMSGAGTNNFQVVLGSEQPVSGNHYYLPVYVDVRYYTYVDVRVTTSRQITANSTPPVGYTYINASPTPTNITDFGADSTVDISNAATAWQVGGNTIIHSGNYTSYPPARWATGRTISLTGDVTGTSGSFDGTANLSFSATLANSGVTAGTYRSVTVDAKGRVTSGTNPTTIAGYGITDALSTTGATMTGALNVTGVDQGLAIQHNGNTSAWFGRIVTKNSTSDRAAFLGTYGTIAGVFAHNNALNAWADLYINTVDGSGGGTVRMPSSVLVNGNQVIHTGNYVSYSPSLTGGGASGTWGINISGSSASCSGNAATATNASQLNGQAGSYYENRSPTAVSISAGTLTITRAAGNLTTTIGGRVVAWCDFNGNFASSQTPNANFNVSSITKNATGDYTVNFSSALANANYVVAGTAQLDTPSPGQSNYNVMVAVPRRSGAKATGSCRIVCEYPLGVALYDSISVGVAFIAA